MRLEVGCLGRGYLHPALHGPPLCGQGGSIRHDNGWCLRGRQTRGGEEEQEVACRGLLAAEDCHSSPIQEARGVLEVFECNVWPGLRVGVRVVFLSLVGVSASLFCVTFW